MTVRQRLLLLSLLEWQEQNPAYLEQLGICVTMNDLTKTEEKKCLN